MSPNDISYDVFNWRIPLLLKLQLHVEAIDIIFYPVQSEAIAYQGKSLDLNNTLTNCQYLEKLVCQVLVLQSIASKVFYLLLLTPAYLPIWFSVNGIVYPVYSLDHNLKYILFNSLNV